MWTEPRRRIIIISHQVLIWTLNAHSPLRSAHLKVQPVCLNLIPFIVVDVSARHFFFFLLLSLWGSLMYLKERKRKKRQLVPLLMLFAHSFPTSDAGLTCRWCLTVPLSASLNQIIMPHYFSLQIVSEQSRSRLPYRHTNPTPVKVPPPTSCCLLSPCIGIRGYYSLSRTSSLRRGLVGPVWNVPLNLIIWTHEKKEIMCIELWVSQQF